MHAAIKLFFEGGDPVAIHTLASAAHEIIHALYRQSGLKGLVFDNPRIPRKHWQQWSTTLKEPFNFFKHGRHDEKNATLEFNPQYSELMMMACCKGLKDIGAPIGMEELALTYWKFCTDHRDFPGREAFRSAPKVKMIQELTTKGREVYFREFTAAYRSGNLVFIDGRTGDPTV